MVAIISYNNKRLHWATRNKTTTIVESYYCHHNDWYWQWLRCSDTLKGQQSWEQTQRTQSECSQTLGARVTADYYWLKELPDPILMIRRRSFDKTNNVPGHLIPVSSCVSSCHRDASSQVQGIRWHRRC